MNTKKKTNTSQNENENAKYTLKIKLKMEMQNKESLKIEDVKGTLIRAVPGMLPLRAGRNTA